VISFRQTGALIPVPAEAISRPNTHGDRRGRRLESWKEIAAYLGRDVTTVRRWERREGLPVYRILHSKLGSVYAYTTELDAWRDSRAPAASTDVSDARPVLEIAHHAARARRWVFVCTAAILALLVVAYLTARSRLRAAAGPKIKSLAVLPLKNLSGDPTQEYLADGMTEALIGRLSSIHDLRVISRTSAMQFKNTPLSVPEIARTLHVDAIVEGSVIRDAGRIRVHAQLIRGATDEHFWSEAYDRELRDVLALQSDVAQSIARKVEITLTGEEHARLTAARSVSPDVYESYLKGRFNKNNSKAELEQSIVYFEDAIKKDPTFASAYVGLANVYDSLGTIFVGAPPAEARQKQMSAARKALELDPTIAEAHVLLADALQRRWQWAEAEAEYRRALDLNPSDSAAHVGFGRWLLCQGRGDDAVAWAGRGRDLDPLGNASASIGYVLFEARHYDEAIRAMRAVIAVRPDDASAYWYLGFALIANDQPEEAIPVLEKAVALTDRGPGAIGVLIRAYAHAGRRAEALQLLAELKRRTQAGYVPTGAFVNAYLGLGDNEQAFTWIERAYQEQSNILQFLKVHPFFDPLRGDPRFKDLLHRVGLG
jgi:TolB-like protein/Flp pilus assembly protein TadD